MPIFNQKKKPIHIKINLAPKDPFFETFLGKSLRWALSVGRYIVIFTELIVILSFLARFTLDRQVTDLNAEINQKESIISSYGSLENDFRTIQKKIEEYEQIEQQTNIAEIFPSLREVTPENVQLEELVIKQDSVILSGRVLSQEALNLLVNNIQLSADFFNIVIDTIESEDDDLPGFEFRLKADTKEETMVKKAGSSR